MRPGKWRYLHRGVCGECGTSLEVWLVRLPRARPVRLRLCEKCDHLVPVESKGGSGA